MPEILTDRLRLRSWKLEDVDPLARILAHPEVERWLIPTNRAQAEEQVRSFLRRWEEDGFCLFAVEERESGTLIGRCGVVHQRDWTASECSDEVGWTLDPAYWGRGLATEGARACLRYAFDEVGLDEVISITRPDNLRSRRVMHKCGLAYQGDSFWRGFDQVWYGVTREEWVSSPHA